MSEVKRERFNGDLFRVDHLVGLIDNLSLSERNLTLSALDFQSIGLAKKHQIEAAIDRAAELGKVLDDLIAVLRKITRHRVLHEDVTDVERQTSC